MNSNKAINILNTQLNKLKSETFGKESTWMSETRSYLDKVIGFEDVLNEGYRDIVSQVGNSRKNGIIQVADIYTYRAHFENILNSAIDRIRNMDIEKKGNFLSRISEGWLIFWCGLIVSGFGLAYGTGFYFGQRNPIEAPAIHLPATNFTPNDKANDSSHDKGDSNKRKRS